MEGFSLEELIKDYSFKVILSLVISLPESFKISKLTGFFLSLGMSSGIRHLKALMGYKNMYLWFPSEDRCALYTSVQL